MHKTGGCTATTMFTSKPRRDLPRTYPRAISEVPTALGPQVFEDQEQGDLDGVGRVWDSGRQVPRPKAGPEPARHPSGHHAPRQTRGVQPSGETPVPSAQGPSWEVKGLVRRCSP